MRRSEAAALSTDAPDFGEAGAWIWPQTVRDSKNRIDGQMAITAADVHNCSALSATDKAAFAQFHADWRKFFCINETGECAAPDVSIWGLGSQQDQCDSFETQLRGWQDKLAGTACHVSGPPLPAPAPGPDLSAVKWLAIALAIGAGLYVANQTGLPRLFPRTKGR